MLRSSTLVLIAAMGVVGSAATQETTIRRADLPAAVERTVQAQSQGATVRGFTVETERGAMFYEAEMTVAGHSKDVLMDATGAVVEVEEQVTLDGLPPAVRDGLRAKAGTGNIVRVESLTKAKGLVAYEAQVVTAGKRSEIQVGPDGKPLDHEE